MPQAVRKRSSSVAPTEEQGKKTASKTKRRKKLEEENCQRSVESDISKNDSGLSSLSTSLNNVESNSGITTPSKESKRQSKFKKKETFEKPTLPPNMIENMNISELLAIGENSGNSKTADVCFSKSSSELEDFSDSGMSDFEEVKSELRDEPVVPKDGVNITLKIPDLHKRRKNKGVDLEAHLKRQINRVKKDLQLLMHKVHLLCWIAHLKFVNNVLNDPSLMESSLKLITSKNLYPSKYADLIYLEGILKWFHKTIMLKKCLEERTHSDGLLKELISDFENKRTCTNKNFILMFIILLRVLGLKTRVVISFQVLPIRPTLFELKDKNTSEDKRKSMEEDHERIGGIKKIKKTDPVVSINDKGSNPSTQNKGKGKRSNKGAVSKSKEGAVSSSLSASGYFDQCDDSELENFKEPKKGHGSKSNLGKKPNCNLKPINKKLLKKNVKEGNKTPCKNDGSDSSDNEDNFTPQSLNKSRKSMKKSVSSSEESAAPKKKDGSDIWAEVYLEAEEKWISVDVCRQKVHCVSELYSRATHPVLYVIACNNDSTLKDVTKRYVPSWHSDTRKKRVDDIWWSETMEPYLPPNTVQNREEDEDITRQLSDKPLPSAISEFKDHPLYALKRHLLKFEAIYPPDAPTLGFVRGEPVYARECVVTLHSREMWYKQARVVRLKEEPYKVVKARPKYDRMTGEIKKDIPLELFGFWQTEEYIPPIAVDGKVPRNEYGNVDLFKPSMLPKGTVHLPIPALSRIAKKLGIDCAPATVGFEFHSGGSHPVFDGFVVCEEFKEILLDTWNKEIDESAKKNEEKREKRVYGNWKRLIRGLLIREKLKIKYAFGENSDEENTPAASSSRASTSKLNKTSKF